MKWLDRAIGAIAPQYAIKRMQVRKQINNFYEAAIPSRLHGRKVNSSEPDDVTSPAQETLRDQARVFEQNYDIGRGVLSVLVANTVGDGIKPTPMVKDKNGDLAKDFNDALKGLWKEWIKNPEVTGDFDYYSAQRMLARSLYRDGEVLVQYLEGNVARLDHQTIVPLSLELIESDYLPMDLDDDKQGIVQGVKKNQWGRATAYRIYKGNPSSTAITAVRDTKAVPAARMVHMKIIDRIRQTRGISIFASVLNRFDDIKEIDENERVAARVAAAMAGFIKKGSPDQYLAPETGFAEREMEFQPGMIFDQLQIGEEIGTIDTTRPNNALIPFRADQLKAVAGGVQASYSSISKNYDGTYSSQRQELVEQYASYGILWAYLKEREARPTWERFVRMAVASKAVDIEGVDMMTINEVEFTRPPLTWIDPKKEMDAIEKELALNLVSKSDVISRRGGDPSEVFKKIAEEKTLFEELGIAPVIEEPVDDTEPPPDNEDTSDEDLSDEDLAALDEIEVGTVVKTIDGYHLVKTEDGYAPVDV